MPQASQKAVLVGRYWPEELFALASMTLKENELAACCADLIDRLEVVALSG